MKKLIASLCLASFVAGLAGCCTVERQAVESIEKTHDLILPEYLKYVEQDPGLDADQKDDRKKLVESLKTLTGTLKKSTE